MVAGVLLVMCYRDKKDSQPQSKQDMSVKPFRGSTLRADKVSWLLSQLKLLLHNVSHCTTVNHNLWLDRTHADAYYMVSSLAVVAMSIVNACIGVFSSALPEERSHQTRGRDTCRPRPESRRACGPPASWYARFARWPSLHPPSSNHTEPQ